MYNTSGNDNTATGVNALFSNTTGFQNVAVGSNSLFNNTTGAYNTALGYNTGPNGSDYVNTTCLGIDATATGSNMVRVGNTFVTSIGGQVGWTALSDGRFKENVKEDVPGLKFITQLRPITYQVNRNKLIEFTRINKTHMDVAQNNITIPAAYKNVELSEITTGFIAQEVEVVANKLGFKFSGIDKPKNETDYYGLRYSEFVVPLVKAVQEQQQIIEKLTKQVEQSEIPMIIGKQQQIIETQQSDIDILKAQVAELTKAVKAITHKQ